MVIILKEHPDSRIGYIMENVLAKVQRWALDKHANLIFPAQVVIRLLDWSAMNGVKLIEISLRIIRKGSDEVLKVQRELDFNNDIKNPNYGLLNMQLDLYLSQFDGFLEKEKELIEIQRMNKSKYIVHLDLPKNKLDR